MSLKDEQKPLLPVNSNRSDIDSRPDRDRFTDYQSLVSTAQHGFIAIFIRSEGLKYACKTPVPNRRPSYPVFAVHEYFIQSK
jgi:hypothetical protein